jgi:hypothetical protein
MKAPGKASPASCARSCTSAWSRATSSTDSGGELVVVRQNLETSSQEALAEQGKRVRLSWRPEHTYEIEKEGT